MTEWTHYNASKYAAKCCYCNRDIHTSEGRWTAPHTDGTKGRFNACHNCIAPPAQGMSADPPPKPTNDTRNAPSSNPAIPLDNPSSVVIPPSIDNTAKPTHTYTPENRIARAHDENMLSAELTRNEIHALNANVTLLRESLHALTNAMNERTRVLVTQLEGDSKGGKG